MIRKYSNSFCIHLSDNFPMYAVVAVVFMSLASVVWTFGAGPGTEFRISK